MLTLGLSLWGGLLASVATARGDSGVSCALTATHGESRRYDCEAPFDVGRQTSQSSKAFHVLVQNGSFVRNTYDHLALMGAEALEGPLEETLTKVHKTLSEGSWATRTLKRKIVDCYSRRIRRSLSEEFVEAVEAGYQGLRVSQPQTILSRDDFHNASIAIELALVFEGLERRMEEDPVGVSAELVAICGSPFSLPSMPLFPSLKWGCLGFVAPASHTQNRQLLHARNFDADLVTSWNRHPTFFLVAEPGYYRYVAAATAGMIYPGGISGFNEKGLAVSLHEMSTTHYQTSVGRHRGMIAPFMQQRLLREASSIDEAIALLRSARHFGAWTFLISDATTQEVASVEVSADRLTVARRVTDQVLGQTNHFLAPEMKDQHFTYSFNKQLESESRLQVITEGLAASQNIDVTWAIDHLAGHQDAFEGFRSFGRTATKAYTLMSTIAIPEDKILYATMGDRRPASHSHFVGFHVDFNRMSFSFIAPQRTHQYDALPFWEASLEAYSQARVSYLEGENKKALDYLDEALLLARQDGIEEGPYLFMRARVLQSLRRDREALRDWNQLSLMSPTFHAYHQALIALYKEVTLQALDSEDQVMSLERQTSLTYAQELLQGLTGRYEHFDLTAKRKLVLDLQHGRKWRTLKLPRLDFVTVE